MKTEEKDLKIEKRTFEQLLSNLRKERNWSYLEVSEELRKLGSYVDELQIRKWEYGLVYPDLDIIYKLSELYFVSSEDFITAKKNSYTKDYHSIHATIIRWFCYLTGFTFKVGYIFFYLALAISLIGAFIFFVIKANSFYW